MQKAVNTRLSRLLINVVQDESTDLIMGCETLWVATDALAVLGSFIGITAQGIFLSAPAASGIPALKRREGPELLERGEAIEAIGAARASACACLF